MGTRHNGLTCEDGKVVVRSFLSFGVGLLAVGILQMEGAEEQSVNLETSEDAWAVTTGLAVVQPSGT